MLADKPTELSRIKLKTWTRQPVPMISEHSAHLTPTVSWLSHLALAIYIFAVVNRKETSCVPLQNVGLEPGVPDTKSPADLMHADKPTELSRIKLKTWTRQPVPFDQQPFSPLDPTVSWLSHLALAIYIFVVVSFDGLAQASDIQIERRQVVFLCRMQGWNLGSQTPNRQQTECSLTNRLSYLRSS